MLNVYFKYTSEFEKRYISLKNLHAEFECKYISLESLLQV